MPGEKGRASERHKDKEKGKTLATISACYRKQASPEMLESVPFDPEPFFPNVMMTERYAHLDPDYLISAVNRI
jgi:hypothetical protein